MKKQTLYSALGIALAFVIAAGGFSVTNALLDHRVNALLSESGSVEIGSPRNGIDPGAAENNSPRLTASEMYYVLQLPTGSAIAHEPVEGQLNMAQAAAEALGFVDDLVTKGVLPPPAEGRRLEFVNAFLSRNAGAGRDEQGQLEACLRNPDFDPNDLRDIELLDPFFSYWTVLLSGGGDGYALLTINAGTGKVWKADLSYFSGYSGYIAEDPKRYFITDEALRAAFLEYLDMEATDALIDITASGGSSPIPSEDLYDFVSVQVSLGLPPEPASPTQPEAP